MNIRTNIKFSLQNSQQLKLTIIIIYLNYKLNYSIVLDMIT